LHHPAAYFFQNVRILSHRRAHFALGQPVRARHVQLERVNTRILAAANKLVPCVAVVLLHNGGNENAVRMLVLHLLEFIDPSFERPIGNKFDVFPAVDLARFPAPQPRIPRLNVDHLTRIKAHRLANHSAPSLFERFANHIRIRPRRTRPDHKRIRQMQTIDDGFECWHRIAPKLLAENTEEKG
jgi:hypothetical protein